MMLFQKKFIFLKKNIFKVKKMKKFAIVSVLLLTLVAVLFVTKVKTKQAAQDHSELISGPFATPQDVTKACLECHEESANDFMKTRHWNWLGNEIDVPGKGKMKIGKRNFINNFCVALPSNEPRCTSCHAGYGWKDNTFDFTKKENVDCLVCHAAQGTYSKTPTAAGMPDPKVDLVKAAQSVGKPHRTNCGICHYNGGGGTNVKHGDLDPSLDKATKELDVHMGGNNFECVECHKSEKHKILGASHGSMAEGINHIACTDCHNSPELHKNKVINKHMNSVACETCHIPTYAKELPTKTWWDWSTAGQKEDVKSADGHDTYSKMKGDFKWEKNIAPEYAWYNGSANYYTFGEKFDPTKVLKLNTLNGSITDPKAKIAPFKVMRGKQIFDTKNNYLIVPKLFGADGYWKTYDWNKASELGMKAVNLNYSGEFGFVETAMWWPINHQVSPKTNALQCKDCHNQGKKMDWAALGYSADPMKKGGRVKNGLVK